MVVHPHAPVTARSDTHPAGRGRPGRPPHAARRKGWAADVGAHGRERSPLPVRPPTAREESPIMTTPSTDRPLAVVTGASSGIGYELAVQFAEHGFDLIVVAEDDSISSAAEKLRRDGGPEVQPVRVDLARRAGRGGVGVHDHRDRSPGGRAGAQRRRGAGGASSAAPTCATSWRSSTSTSARRCTWRSGCCRAWSSGARAGSCSPRRSPRPCRGPSRRSTTRRSRSCSPSPRRCATS